MKKFLLSLVMAITMLVGVGSLGGPVYAAPAPTSTDAAKAQACAGVRDQAGAACGSGGVSLNKVITGVINLLSAIAGIAAVIMIIISGIRYISSQGEAQAVSGAKRGLMYAVVGLIVVALAQFIVRFVLTNV